MQEFTGYPDLAARSLAGSVISANDEMFASRHNLITPYPVAHDALAFGHTGKIYDGWETRRRRESGSDWAIVRLGVPGVVHGVVVDTAFFRGNYPPAHRDRGDLDRGLPGGRGRRTRRVGDPGREGAVRRRHP